MILVPFRLQTEQNADNVWQYKHRNCNWNIIWCHESMFHRCSGESTVVTSAWRAYQWVPSGQFLLYYQHDSQACCHCDWLTCSPPSYSTQLDTRERWWWQTQTETREKKKKAWGMNNRVESPLTMLSYIVIYLHQIDWTGSLSVVIETSARTTGGDSVRRKSWVRLGSKWLVDQLERVTARHMRFLLDSQ